jgi:hypothetical protein
MRDCSNLRATKSQQAFQMLLQEHLTTCIAT